MKHRIIIMFVVSVLAVVNTASAVFDVAGLDGTWSNVVGGSFINIDNGAMPRTVRWGDPWDQSVSGLQSGLGFEPAATPLSIPLDTPFDMGVLTHFNFPVEPGTAATSADLNVAMQFGGDLAGFNPAFAFTLHVNETYNSTGDPVLDGDIITISGPNPPSAGFVVDNQKYVLTVLGFEDENGFVVDQFLSPENGSNEAILVGQISVAPIPAPGALLLGGLGTGLVGLLRRRRAM